MLENKIYSAAGLWKDIDDEGLGFDTTVISDKTEEGGGITKKWVYFNGRKTQSGECSRILALIAYKSTKAKLPALVLIPASGKTIDEPDASFWAGKGYAVIAFDNAGECENSKHTIYPSEIDYANFLRSGRHLSHCDQTAKETSWYEWAVNARRAVTFIRSEPFVKKDEVMILSVGDGSLIACMLGAFDSRVTAVAVLSGPCWIDVDSLIWDDPEERDRWAAAIAPQSYIMSMAVPFYTCAGTNSKEADAVKTHQALLAAPGGVEKAMLFVPGVVAGGDENFFSNIDKWFNYARKGEKVPVPPVSEFEIRDRKLFANVTTQEGETVKDVKVLFAREGACVSSRYWSELKSVKDGCNRYTAQPEIVANGGAAYCFATVTYKGGFAISGNKATVKEDRLINEVDFALPSRLVFRGSTGQTPFASYDPAEFTRPNFFKRNRPQAKKGPFDIDGVAGNALSTFALRDPKFVKEADSILTFDVYSENEQQLRLYYVKNFGESQQQVYDFSVELLGGDMWQKISVCPHDFRNETQCRPENWTDCQMFSFVADEEIIVNNLLFT